MTEVQQKPEQRTALATHTRKRLLLGFGANVYGQLVVAVVQIVGVPILLHAWGTELYGEWLILFAIPSYLSLTDLGFSQSAANDMAARVARDDRNGALAVFQSLLGLVFGAAIVGILIVTVVLWLLPFGHWLHFARLSTDQVRWILWLLAAEVLVRLTEGSSHAGFRSTGEYGLHVSIYFTTMFFQFAGIWAAALLGYGPVTAATIYIIVRCIATTSVAVLLLHRHTWLRYGLVHARLSELQRLARPALANICLPLAQAVNIQGMLLVVAAMLGPLAVVVFATLRTLTRLALQGVLTVSHALEPELAFAWGTGNKLKLRKLYLYGLGYSFWLSLAAAVALYFLGGWILALWTQDKVTMNEWLFDWLLLSTVAGAFWYGGLILRKAANLHMRAVIWYVGSSLASVAIAGFLMRFTERLADAGLALLLTDVSSRLMEAFPL